MTYPQHHASDLSVSTLAQLDSEVRAVAVALDQRDAGFRRAPSFAGVAVVEEHAVLELAEGLVIDPAAHGDVIRLVHLVTRVTQAVGELAVVGQQQESGGVHVQTPDGEETRFRRMLDEIDRARATLGIAVRADHAARLEEHDVDRPLRPHDLPVDDDAVVFGINPGREVGDEVAVDGDGALLDEGFAGASGGDPGLGKELLQTHAARAVLEILDGGVDGRSSGGLLLAGRGGHGGVDLEEVGGRSGETRAKRR